MNKVIMVELRFFAASVIWGMLLIVFYDLLRIFRRVVKHNGFFIAIEDIIYWVICSLLIFRMMYEQNNGIIRGFSILAMLLGMLIFHHAISDFFVNIISVLIHKLFHFIGMILKTIFKPFYFVLKKIKKVFSWVFRKIKKFRSKILLLKKNRKSSKMAVSDDEKGD
ncbi:spore cortex biosynthesis protein YabQ [Anaerocolumna aminovalerica]|uniref:spore cortex biosynthesis protein YabQ n=1 Tax=Anaerocolumna aminovalerica TaxID=1527 RepID=UPI000BE439FE|nr:spore cortex biosynthesis protein YabQ [Anaerocolumna aminovalerica]